MALTAYNQITIPDFMYGTAWKQDATTRLVELAVESGFRAIDTANQMKHYREDLVGQALLAAYKSLGREALFLQSKFTSVEGQDHRLPYDPKADLASQVKQSMDSSLAHLHTDYLDSYVLHGPYSRHSLGTSDWEVWAAIEDLYKAGKTRMIGISNVSGEQLKQLCAKAATKPMVVQNRCYAVMGWDSAVREICRAHDIIYQGFSLLTANQPVLSSPAIVAIARRLGVGPAQVIFRFAMQVGMLPLTGTSDPEHMKQDLAVTKLDLTAAELQEVENSAGYVRRL